MTQTVNVSDVIDTQPLGALQLRVFLLCAAVLFVDGFDVQGITYVAPAISQEWGLARGALGPTFSAGLFGVMLGAVLLAPLADRIGRRRVIVLSCVAFGLGTLLTLWVGSLTELLVLRFFTGLGLGAALPNAIGLASEYAPKKHRASIVMFVSSGISLGAIAVGMVAARLISTAGWQAVFVVGGVLPLLLAAALYRYLPESILWRQKEQFSDGVGYGWIDGLKAHAEAQVSDRELAAADKRFPVNPPQTKEAYFYRTLFEQRYPGQACAETVPGGKSIACSSPAAIAWDASFAKMADPSGRAVSGVHNAAL